MELNSDFSQRVAVHGADLPWQSSPLPGVHRRMFDRIGDEVARATSIVRYAPGSAFSPHVHTGGEEFLVLDGVFQDEHGDFPAGTYVRNPPESRHTPSSAQGCTIFVKLWQFDLADRTPVTRRTAGMSFDAAPGRDSVETLSLFEDSREYVALEKWLPSQTVTLDAPRGMEILVLDGAFVESGGEFHPQSWLRLPADATSEAIAGEDGATVWIKRGHLAEPQTAPRDIVG
ncbi:MAG: anti-sigma factor ChrR (cupin superfamily) [Paracoccaceae bacterium]|jgi:anti-sigma factor ChrR (cupin superfamily)